MSVTAVDISANAIKKLKSQAVKHCGQLRTEVQDVRTYRFAKQYDLIIAHGLLHLLPHSEWSRIIHLMQKHTKPLGFNIVAVFTDLLPPPEDLRSFITTLKLRQSGKETNDGEF